MTMPTTPATARQGNRAMEQPHGNGGAKAMVIQKVAVMATSKATAHGKPIYISGTRLLKNWVRKRIMIHVDLDSQCLK
jgi:hypothetical protein